MKQKKIKYIIKYTHCEHNHSEYDNIDEAVDMYNYLTKNFMWTKGQGIALEMEVVDK